MLLGEETLQSSGRSYSMPQLVMMSVRLGLGCTAGLGLGFTMTEGRSRCSGRLVVASLISCSSSRKEAMFSILIIFYSLVGFLFLNFFCVLGHDCLEKRRHDALLKKHTRCAGVARLLHS